MDVQPSGASAWLNYDHIVALLGAFLGSMTSAYFDRDIQTWREKGAAFVFGGVCAVAIGPEVAHYFGFGKLFFCYLFGYFGLNLCAASLKIVKRTGNNPNADFWTLFCDLARNIADKIGKRIEVFGEKPPTDGEDKGK